MSCSISTPRSRRRATKSTVCVKYTLRSSSPWMKSTGDFQVFTAVTGEESWASLVNSGEIFLPSQLSVGQSWTPWMSTPAPESDAFAVHVAASLQIFSSRHDVLVLLCAAARAARGFAKRAAVTDSAAVIQRQYHITAAGEILIHGVGIRVVVHVVPAEEHLAHGAAMEENHGWEFCSRFQILRQEQLRVDLQPVSGLEFHLLRLDEIIRGNTFRKIVQ